MSEKEDQGLKFHGELGMALFSTAALVLTINLGIITATVSKNTLSAIITATVSKNTLSAIKIPVFFSSILLLISMLSGVVNVATVRTKLSNQDAKIFSFSGDATMYYTSVAQTWTLFISLLIIGYAVYLRFGG